MASTQTKNRLPSILLAISILAFAGVVLSIIQTLHFYDLHSGQAGFRSFCNVGKAFSCDAIEASQYATFAFGIPLSAFAGGWFLGLLSLSLLARSDEWRSQGVRAITAMAGIAALFSLIYFIIMSTVLKTYCLLCLGVDVVNVALLGATLMAWKSAGTKTSSESHWKTFAGIVAGCLFLAVILARGQDASGLTNEIKEEMFHSVMDAQPLAVTVTPDLPSIGPKDAPVTIIKFSDFQCPHCKLGALTLHPALKRYAGKVLFVYRSFPLDPTCNRMMQGAAGHSAACEAARAGFCASKQGKFEEAYMDLFDKQDEIAPGKVADLLAGLKIPGLDDAQLRACMSSSEAADHIAKDIEEGLRLGVQSTPTFFINGRKRETPMPVEVWTRLIESMLSLKQGM